MDVETAQPSVTGARTLCEAPFVRVLPHERGRRTSPLQEHRVPLCLYAQRPSSKGQTRSRAERSEGCSAKEPARADLISACSRRRLATVRSQRLATRRARRQFGVGSRSVANPTCSAGLGKGSHGDLELQLAAVGGEDRDHRELRMPRRGERHSSRRFLLPASS